MYVCMYVYIYIYIYMLPFIYIYTYICCPRLRPQRVGRLPLRLVPGADTNT